MKPKLKAPGINLLTLKFDEPLSTFAFKFNLRRYNMAEALPSLAERMRAAGLPLSSELMCADYHLRRCALACPQCAAGAYSRSHFRST